MTGKEYQELAMRTNDGNCTKRLIDKADVTLDSEVDFGGLLNASLGLSGEVGELNDMVKKWVFHEHPADITHLCRELGDILWYVAMFCSSMNWDMETIMELNIEKLKARYPEGFNPEQSLHRAEGDV